MTAPTRPVPGDLSPGPWWPGPALTPEDVGLADDPIAHVLDLRQHGKTDTEKFQQAVAALSPEQHRELDQYRLPMTAGRAA